MAPRTSGTAARPVSFGLAEPERGFEYLEQALEFSRHQGEARIEFGTHVLAFARLELIDRAVEELQLAHDQVLAEHERKMIVQGQGKARDLLARLQVLGDLVALQFLA